VFLSEKYVSICFILQKALIGSLKFIDKQYVFMTQIYFCMPEIFQTGFRVQNHLLNLCSSAVDLQRLLCSQKAGVKCSY
jgi:hypothetical protein